MKALEKDRNPSLRDGLVLRADIERHLDNLPVEAGPPGAAYRLRKFAYRNREAVAAAAVLVVVLTLGLLGTTRGSCARVPRRSATAASAPRCRTCSR